RPARGVGQRLEAAEVVLVPLGAERVARRARLDPLRPERPAELGHVHLEHLWRARRRRVAPEALDERLGRDDASRVQEQARERAEDAAARARFLREARLSARIESRHVVPVLEVGESYLVLPYYPRGSLALLLREEGKLTLDRTVRLAAELGRGLDVLHEHGI